jgi:PhnB protein
MPKRLPKRPLAEQLEEVVQGILVSLQPRPEPSPHRSLAPLATIARELRYLPRAEFRATLKSDLRRRASMSIHESSESSAATAPAKTVHYMRPGFTSITPYIIVNGAVQFLEFLKSAFDGVERLRVPAPDGTLMHSEVAIGNGMIEAADASAQIPPAPTDIHLYVDEADATFDRALAAGATSIYRPTDEHPSGDRWGALQDPFGNRWYIARPKGWTPGPEGLRSVQPYLHLRGAHNMIPFMVAAFSAEAMGVHKSPEGIVHHATMRIGNATLEIDEAHGEYQPKPCHLHVYVPNADAMYAQALRAGAVSVEPPNNKPYGDRSAAVKDAFRNTWYLNTYLGQ